MKIYIIRHGETDANKNKIMQGWLDKPLNENGIELAKEVGTNLKGIKFKEAFTSPLTRALETCKLVLNNSDNSNCPIIIDERIKELNMGDLEGKLIDSLDPNIIKELFSNPIGTPNGETKDEVINRTQAFLKELINRNDDNTYLVSTHGFAYRAMLNFLYADPSNFWQGHVPYNCAISVIEAKDNKIELIENDKIYYDNNKIIDRYK